MATFLDISLLNRAEVIFAFIFIWIGVYAILTHTKWLGDKKNNIYAVLAFAVAILTIFTKPVMKSLLATIPWFVFFMIVGVFIMLVVMSVGYTSSDIHKTIMSKGWGTPITVWIVIIAVIILASGLGSVFFTPGDTPTNTTITLENGTVVRGEVGEVGTGAFFATIFHPKVLGLIIVMLIGALVVHFLGKGSLD